MGSNTYLGLVAAKIKKFASSFGLVDFVHVYRQANNETRVLAK